MSEATHPTGGLTRRGFLKTTGAAAAGLACAGAVGAAIGGGMLADNVQSLAHFHSSIA